MVSGPALQIGSCAVRLTLMQCGTVRISPSSHKGLETVAREFI